MKDTAHLSEYCYRFPEDLIQSTYKAAPWRVWPAFYRVTLRHLTWQPHLCGLSKAEKLQVEGTPGQSPFVVSPMWSYRAGSCDLQGAYHQSKYSLDVVSVGTVITASCLKDVTMNKTLFHLPTVAIWMWDSSHGLMCFSSCPSMWYCWGRLSHIGDRR